MTRRAYPKYKDSGIPWIEEIPGHWHVERLKHVSSVQLSNVDKVSDENEIPVRLCNYVDVYYNDFIHEALDFMSATATREEIRRFRLRQGDVLITKDSEAWDDIAVPACVVDEREDLLCGYHLAHIRPHINRVDGRYLFRAFCSRGINDQFRVAATGVTRFGLGKYWIDNGVFPVPPLPEQRAIAAFLDRETARIDGLIEKKQRQIELLQEKRAALISHAVTKGLPAAAAAQEGLDPDVPMKDSGIEWLGQIPEHWEIKQLRRLTPDSRPIMYGIVLPGPDVADGVPIVKSGDIHARRLNLESLCKTTTEIESRYERSRLRGGDIVYSIRGSIGDCDLVPDELRGANLTQDAARVSPRRGVRSRWLLYMLRSRYAFGALEAGALGATIRGINIWDLKRVRVPFPDEAEQEAIATFLDRETARIDTLIAKVGEAIERLKEYRTALISAAVTGKIDVRGEG